MRELEYVRIKIYENTSDSEELIKAWKSLFSELNDFLSENFELEISVHKLVDDLLYHEANQAFLRGFEMGKKCVLG